MATILVVDDRPANRDYLVALLGYRGHRVLQAGDGAEALAILRAEHPDLVITDILMPQMTGVDLARQVREGRSTAALPIVFYSATYPAREARILAEAADVDYHLAKPAAPEEILALVDRIVGPGPAGDRSVPDDLRRKDRDLLTERLTRKVEHLQSEMADRMRAEDSLRESVERYRSLVEGTHDLVQSVGPDGRFEFVNRAWREALGYAADEVTGLDLLWVVHPDSREHCLAVLRRALAGESLRDVTASWMTKDGRRLEVEGTVTAQWRDGRVVASHWLVRNVTDRRRMSAALRANHERLRAILDGMPSFVGLLATDGTLLEANRAALQVIDLARDEVVGRRLADLPFFTHTAAVAAELRAALALAAQGEVVRYDTEARVAGGRLIPIDLTFAPLRDAAGNVVQVIGSAIDITDRMRAEALLRESEERLRLAMDAAHMGIYDWDVATDRITWSRWHEELWGFAPGEFAGTYESFASRVHPDDIPGINAEVGRCMGAREPFEREFRVVWADGSVHWVVGVGEFTFDDAGRAVRMHGVVREITQRKHAEAELAASHVRLTALSRQLLVVQETERRHLARELHDELGQVLTLVKMNIQAARRAGPAGGADRLDAALAATERAIGQVRSLSLDLRPSMLDDFGLQAALEWYVGRCAAPGGPAVRLEADLGNQRYPPEVETACFRVVQEAVTNALRHARATRVLIRVGSAPGGLRLAVQDDGRGFDIAAARAQAARGDSTGLLSMEERVRLLGGRFAVGPAAGGGTGVSAEFPLPNPLPAPEDVP